MDRYANLGYIIALFVILMDLVPTVISLLLFCDGKDKGRKTWKDMAGLGFCICIHLGSYMLIHKVFFGHWNFLNMIRDVKAFDFTYQEIVYFPFSLFVRSIMALIVGYGLRYTGITDRNRPVRLPRKRIAALYALFLAVGIAVIGTLSFSFSGIQNIVINEVGNYNVAVSLDAEGTVCDYIELYNKGSLACAVEDMYLSDRDTDLKRKAIPAAVVPANGYLVVKLDDNSLNLRKEGGETIFLSNVWGHVLDRITTAEVEPDFSFCRVDDAGADWTMRSATPGSTNDDGIARLQTIPELSHSSGFYEEAFDLQIFAEDGARIYYTLDGSIPTVESELYTKPIRVYNRSQEPNVWRSQQRVVLDWENYTPDSKPVDKAFILRAIAVDGNGAVSKPVTATYFVGLEEYSKGNVVSLVVDPDDFWGENGIYVTGEAYDLWYSEDRTESAPYANFELRGRKMERPVCFQYFSEDGTFEQNAGIRVSGGSSRNHVQKSVSLYAREVYDGSDFFRRSFFEDIQSRKLAIRGGYANAVCQMLARDRAFATQRSERAAVFINGEFWYHANILEKYDAQYFYEHYGVNPNNVLSVKGRIYLQEGMPGEELLLDEVYDYLAANDLSDSSRYAGFAELVDIQSYIDYMCFNIYIDNMDFSELKNAVLWRSREVTSRPYEDGKWRFVLYDLDAMEWNDAHMWGLETQAQKNSFSLIPRYLRKQPINQQPIYMALKKNPAFVKQFVLTFMDLVNENFRYEKVKSVLDAYGPAGAGYHGGNGGTQDISYYETFFKTRASYIVPYMAEEFALNGTLETLHLEINDSNAGYIQLNTIVPDLSEGKWNGQYYTDFPITVTAVAEEGYVFKGWGGDLHSAEASLELKLNTGGTSLYAVFEKEIP